MLVRIVLKGSAGPLGLVMHLTIILITFLFFLNYLTGPSRTNWIAWSRRASRTGGNRTPLTKLQIANALLPSDALPPVVVAGFIISFLVSSDMLVDLHVLFLVRSNRRK